MRKGIAAQITRAAAAVAAAPPAATVFDLMDDLQPPSAARCEEILHLVHGVRAPAAARFYARRIAALGLRAADSVPALLRVLPGTVLRGQSVLAGPSGERDAWISTKALQGMLATSEPSLRPLIDRLVRSYDATDRPAEGWGEPPVERLRARRAPRDLDELGVLRCAPDPHVAAACYLIPTHKPDWRAGMVSAMNDVACVVATRTPDAGLLLGPDISFLGRYLDGDVDEFPPGWVLFGPKRDLEEGHYRLEVDLELQQGDGVLLDIVSNHGLSKLAELDLRGSTRFNLGFKVTPDDRHLEVRIVNVSSRTLSARIGKLMIRTC